MYSDFTATLEISYTSFDETTKFSLTNKDGITTTDALAKIFDFMSSTYGYRVDNHAIELLQRRQDEARQDEA
jgi:hypothetical protein